MNASSINQDGRFYKDVLKYVLRKQIQTLVNQLLEETGDETLVLSASLGSGLVTQIGSERARAFMIKDSYVATNFLEFLQKDPGKYSAAPKDSFKSRNGSKRTQAAISQIEEIQSPVKPAKLFKVQPKQHEKDCSSSSCSDSRLSSQSEKRDDSGGLTPQQSIDEFDGIRPQHVELEGVPESLEMSAYTEEEQTSLLNRLEIKNEMLSSQERSGTSVETATDNQEFGLKNTVQVNIECALAEPNVNQPVNETIPEEGNDLEVNSDSDGSIQGEDSFDNVIIKTEPFDFGDNDSMESAVQSVDNSDINVYGDLPTPDCSGTTQSGSKHASSVSDSLVKSGDQPTYSSEGKSDVRSSEDKYNTVKAYLQFNHGLDRMRVPKADGKEPEQPIKRFKPFENAFVSKQKDQNTEESTRSQTKWAVSILKEWMKESEMDCKGFELWPEEQLDNLLEMFYSCVRTKKGTEYSRSSLIGIRSGINRYLIDPPFSRNLSLMKDRVFMGSNQIIEGKINYLKREQLDVSEHREPISEDDMKRLYQSGVFSTENPKTLQQKVQFELMLQFGQRGREGLRYLKKDSFKLETDSSGVRYITMSDEGNKSHHGVDNTETVIKPKMYEQVGDKHCPVSSFLKYVSKLNPTCDAFFQRPMTSIVKESDKVWYGNHPVGINTLNTLMPRLSADADLSSRYTNHCIKATTSTTLQRAGVSKTAIMSVTGHKNVRSLISYVKATEKDISKILSNPNNSREQN